jgi:MFS family permease
MLAALSPRWLREGLASADLRRFQLGAASSSFSLWAFSVVLGVVAYREGGAPAVGLAVLTRFLPAAFAAPVAGLLGDRMSRRLLLLWTLAASTTFLGGLVAAVAVGAPFAVVLILASGFTVASTARYPAQAALIPTYTNSLRELAAANGLWNAIENIFFAIGSLVAGVLIASTSTQFALAVATFACALAAGAIATLRPDERPQYDDEEATSLIAELLGGLAEVRRTAGLPDALGLLSASMLLDGLLDVVLVVLALRVLGVGAGGLGWLNGAWGLGGLLGGIGGLALLGRGRFARASWVACLLLGGALAALAAHDAVAIAAFVFVAVGAGLAIFELTSSTLLQRLTAEEAVARAFGVQEACGLIAAAVGSAIAPVLIDSLGIRATLAAGAAVTPLLVLARSRAIARFDVEGAVATRQFSILRALDVFAPLPLATIETLARHSTEVTYAVGEVVIREGDGGDLFYAILEGSAEVSQAGRIVRTQGPGEYFGEIALLRDVPRTATVTARSELVLLSLDREMFLTAVTGHPRSRRAAHATAEERLLHVPA